jgi:hypothetical protein
LESPWPLARIPNSSPSQVRYNPNESILRFVRGDCPKKRHPHSLGLNLHCFSCDQGVDNRAFFAPLLKSVTLTFECLIIGIHSLTRQLCTRVSVLLGLHGLTSWPSRPFTLFAILMWARHGVIIEVIPPAPTFYI